MHHIILAAHVTAPHHAKAAVNSGALLLAVIVATTLMGARSLIKRASRRSSR